MLWFGTVAAECPKCKVQYCVESLKVQPMLERERLCQSCALPHTPRMACTYFLNFTAIICTLSICQSYCKARYLCISEVHRVTLAGMAAVYIRVAHSVASATEINARKA